MKRINKVTFSILAMIVVVAFGLRAASRSSAATPAHVSKPVPPPSASQTPLVKTYGNLLLSFEANQGQTESRVKFLSRGGGYARAKEAQ